MKKIFFVLALLTCFLATAQKVVRVFGLSPSPVKNMFDNFDGSFTLVNEAGVFQTIQKADMVDNFDYTWVYTNYDGSDVVVDARTRVFASNASSLGVVYHAQHDMATPNTNTSFTASSSGAGGYVQVKINVATEPTFTNATKLPRTQAFIANTDMILHIKAYGTTVKYWFTEF